MKLSAASRTVVSFSLFLVSSTYAQTYSTCNPLQGSCPADPALGTTSEVSFTSASSDYTETGNSVSYGSGGAQLTVSASGDNPTLTSQWYIMFGKVDFVFKSAPGTGMVSSAILLSDDLDEIDWELLGADSSQAQSNYFGKGVTGAYGRGGFSSIPSSQTDYNTYTIDWNAERILWQINGATMRTLTYEEAAGQYPQTPMQVKIGAWAGGDPSNAEGTIEWAGGPIDYSAGPYSMYVQSVNVQDYSTGSEYKYDGSSGSWQSITAVGGTVGSSGAGSSSGSGSGSSGTGTFASPRTIHSGISSTFLGHICFEPLEPKIEYLLTEHSRLHRPHGNLHRHAPNLRRRRPQRLSLGHLLCPRSIILRWPACIQLPSNARLLLRQCTCC